MNRQSRIQFSFWATTVILIFTFLVNILLSYSSFIDLQKQALTSEVVLFGGELRHQIESELKIGRPLSRFIDLEKHLSRTVVSDPALKEGLILDTDGTVLAASSPAAGQGHYLKEEIPVFTPSQLKDSGFAGVPWNIDRGESFLLPLVQNDSLSGYLVLVSNPARSIESTNSMVAALWPWFAATFVTATLLLLLIGAGKRNAWLATALATGVLIASHCLIAFATSQYFESYFVSSFRGSSTMLSHQVRDEVQSALNRGLGFSQMSGVDELLSEKVRIHSESKAIYLFDSQDELVASSNAAARTLAELRGSGEILTSLDSKGQKSGTLAVVLNREIIEKATTSLFLDIITVLIVVLILGTEVARVRELNAPGKELEPAAQTRSGVSLIRVLAFLFFFAAMLPLSFLPGLFESLSLKSPVAGFDPTATSGWPIASYLLGTTIAVAIFGFLSARINLRRLFVISGVLFGAGLIATLLSTDIGGMTTARFVTGLGYGGMITLSTTLIIASVPSENRGLGFGSWGAGFASASICGIPIGGVIVSRLSWAHGIFICLIVVAVLLAIIWVFVRKDNVAAPAEAAPAKSNLLKDTLQALRSNTIFVTLLCVSVPAQMAFVGLFQYALPLQLMGLNFSSADVGRILTLVGLISLLTPILSTLSDRHRAEKRIIVIGNLVAGGLLTLFFFWDNLAVICLAVIGLGLSSIVLDSVLEAYLSGSPEATKLGQGQFLAQYSTVEKAFTIFVPLLTTAIIGFSSYAFSIGIIGVLLALGALVFQFMAKDFQRSSEGAQ